MMNQITRWYNLLNIKQMCFTKSPFLLIEYHSSKDTYLSKCQMHLSNALVWKINPLDSQLNSITWQVHSFIPNVCIHLFICYLEKGLPISSKVISDVLIEQLFFSIKKNMRFTWLKYNASLYNHTSSENYKNGFCHVSCQDHLVELVTHLHLLP